VNQLHVKNRAFLPACITLSLAFSSGCTNKLTGQNAASTLAQSTITVPGTDPSAPTLFKITRVVKDTVSPL
jgi:hypothetical protein